MRILADKSGPAMSCATKVTLIVTIGILSLNLAASHGRLAPAYALTGVLQDPSLCSSRLLPRSPVNTSVDNKAFKLQAFLGQYCWCVLTAF